MPVPNGPAVAEMVLRNSRRNQSSRTLLHGWVLSDSGGVLWMVYDPNRRLAVESPRPDAILEPSTWQLVPRRLP